MMMQVDRLLPHFASLNAGYSAARRLQGL